MTSVMGRPRIEFDESHWRSIDNLCGLMCTAEEIAGFLEVSVDTLERRIREKYNCTFAEYFKERSARGKISLRRHQYKLAEAGNPTMLIWLGKQYLGQTDKQGIDHTSSDGSMSPSNIHSLTDEELLKVINE